MKKKALITIVLILLIDQISKIYIKTNFFYHEEIYIFDWFRIHFIENKGMAWGAEFGGKTGKLFLTLFRLVAVTGIAFWLNETIKNKARATLIIGISMIFAGALGNIIDSLFYGILFDASTATQKATLFAAKPYGEFLHGKVVDMLYFPIWEGVLPHWIPYYGGKNFTFFNAIFNVADAAITTGVALLILFKNKTPKTN